MKIKSVKFNFIMNFILTASNFIFPLITFPYVSRVLGASGTGKVSFAISVVSYFTMVAALGIPTYGIRTTAKVRDDQEKLNNTRNVNYSSIYDVTSIYCIHISNFIRSKISI